MRTIFITAFQPFISRTLLNTGTLDAFLARGAWVVIFVSRRKEAYYKKHFTQDNVIVEGIDEDALITPREKRFHNIAELLLDTNIKKFHKMHFLYDGGSWVTYVYQRLFTMLFARLGFVKKLFQHIDTKNNHFPLLDKYFREHKPDVVFTPFIFGKYDVSFAKAARYHKVPLVSGVLSWDNATTKTLMRVVPDKLVVQNEIIKEEMVKYHGVDPRTVCVTGITHYDYYKQYQPKSREEFFKEMGIPEDKKIVLVSPAGSKFIDTDWQILDMLQKAYNRGDIDQDAQFLVRPHPTNTIDLDSFTPDEHFTIDVPGQKFEGVRAKDNELSKDDIHHLLDTLAHTTVLINTVSTIMLDAAVFGVPTITISFEGYEKKVHFVRSVKRYLEELYMAKLLAVGGTDIVKNPDELVQAVNKYVRGEDDRKEKREQMLAEQAYKLDGKTKERVVDCVLEAAR